VHPFNDYNVIAGQATAALELLEEVSDLDGVIAPIGGGGLMSGTALAVHYLAPNAKIYGAEPLAVDDAYRSMQSGTIQENPTTDTIADGLKTNLGDKTFAIIQAQLSEIFTVSEEEIIDAMKLVWSRMKIIIEPSCAVPLAAILRNKEKFAGQRIGIILTGGNVDLDNLPF
jgi:threonine dehydratase